MQKCNSSDVYLLVYAKTTKMENEDNLNAYVINPIFFQIFHLCVKLTHHLKLYELSTTCFKVDFVLKTNNFGNNWISQKEYSISKAWHRQILKFKE